MRTSRNEWAMQLALVTAQRATCLRRSVGCVLLNERGHVLATGYNGVASGQQHCNEGARHSSTGASVSSLSYPHACLGAHAASGTNLDGCQAIHSEQNALLQCRDPWEIHTCYVTTSPCMTCTKLLLNTSCQEVYFVEWYSHAPAMQLWHESGRRWTQLNIKMPTLGLNERP